MEKFYLEVPTINRDEDAVEYVNEFYQYNSQINGSGGLDRYLNNYNDWLDKIEEDTTRIPSQLQVPSRTFFLVRENDNKIVGMINIRIALNYELRNYGGNIDFSIRPTERGKGYNKINLYLGLKVCQEYGIDKVLLDSNKENLASWKTIEALGGINTKNYYDVVNNENIKSYEIDVDKTLSEYETNYEQFVSSSFKNR